MYKLICVALIVAVCVCGLNADDPPIPGYQCPLDDITRGCTGGHPCFYQNDKDCASYIECTDAGLAYKRQCPPGLLWTNTMKRCDWPQYTTCH